MRLLRYGCISEGEKTWTWHGRVAYRERRIVVHREGRIIGYREGRIVVYREGKIAIYRKGNRHGLGEC